MPLSPLCRALLTVAVICIAPTTWAASPRSAALPPASQALVDRAVAYLQGLTTAQGRFVQSDPRGFVSQGTFYLQRPGRARFDYDPPSGKAVASDGHLVSVVDRRLKTLQNYPLGYTPLGLFLAKDIRLDRGVAIGPVIEGADSFTIVARDARKPSQGQIALIFAAQPVALRGWALTDAQGATVKVSLSGFRRAAPHPAAFFHLADPRPGPAPGDIR